MALVTVIIPNYNHAKYLKERVDSVLYQTFQDFEIIIFDDASFDDSVAILNEYKNHPKVSQFIINEINSGSPFAQWEKGITLAKGKYIWIAETDDFAENTFLEKTVEVLNQDERLGLVYTDSKIIDENGNEISYWSEYKNSFFKTNKWSSDYVISGREEILDYLLYKVTINNVSAVLFRKQVLEEVDFKKLMTYRNVGDLFVYLSICLKNEINYIKTPLNNYREHQFNTTKINTINGNLYEERIECYSVFLSLLQPDSKNNTEKNKLKKAIKFIVLKNGFILCDLEKLQVLTLFIKNIGEYNLFNFIEISIVQQLFMIYSKTRGKIKGGSKKLIKIILKS